MVFALYLYSYVPVAVFASALWYELHNKGEFGERPKFLLKSVAAIVFTGLTSLLAVFAGGSDPAAVRLLFVSAAFPMFLIGAYLLEYSIHCQRIRKSFLTEDHERAYKPAGYAISLLTLVSAVSTGLMIAILAGADVDVKEIADKTGFTASVLVFAAALYIALRLFNFQEGLIRKKHYPFVLIAAATVVTNFSYLFIGNARSVSLAGFCGILILSGYSYRMYQEYFYFRLFHVSDLLLKQESAARSRNKLINLSIVSTMEKDVDILSELMDSMLERMIHELPLPQYKITGLALYRLKNGVFSIQHKTLIKGYCAPLTKFDAIKLSSDEQVRKLNMDTRFDAEQLLASGPGNAADFTEEAVYRLLSEKETVYIDPLPPTYKGVVKMMALYPIMNNDAISGFYLIEKDSFDRLFPQELTLLADASGGINTLFSLMHGKDVLVERNRLEGEMNIAEEIQTSIVPKAVDIPGYDTACSMSTASEVGGDAYDFVKSPFGHYFSIGDVSGHGLPSGIMALIQITAFQTALETSGVLKRELKISEVYDIINRVLCTINRDRIGSDKFMTGNVFVENEGIIRHAGTHEIALLYKKATAEVIRIHDTADKTAFLGLSELVVSTQSEGSFPMEYGDILLLYTDGAIEAKNDSGEQYGLERLSNSLKNNSGLPLEELIAVLEKDVRLYAKLGDVKKNGGNLADDLTFFVMRKQ